MHHRKIITTTNQTIRSSLFSPSHFDLNRPPPRFEGRDQIGHLMPLGCQQQFPTRVLLVCSSPRLLRQFFDGDHHVHSVHADPGRVVLVKRLVLVPSQFRGVVRLFDEDHARVFVWRWKRGRQCGRHCGRHCGRR